MATNQAVKKNQASLHVLKTLKVLMEDNYTMSEIVDKLNSQENGVVFNNSVVSKYINTCRFCGIEIEKFCNKYYVVNMPFGLNLEDKDLDIIHILQKTAETYFSAKLSNSFQKIFAKINKITNKHITKVDKKEKSKSILDFEQAIEANRKINLITAIDCFSDLIPLGIVYNGNRVFFNISNDNNERLISIDKVVAIEVLNTRFTSKKTETTVLFKLTGGLAKRYTPRENETVEISSESNAILVANKGEHKEILFARLLRYDSCCEIISPKSYREEMRQLLKNMLSNYEE